MNYAQLSDEELMMAYKGGDRHAFSFILEKHKKGIYNFLYRFLSNSQNTDEAFQEVFLRVIRSADSYIPTAKLSTWLYTIARNYCIDVSRKKKLRLVTSLEEKSAPNGEGLDWEEKFADDKASPDEMIGAKNLAEKLQWALDQINGDQKEVFLMRENLHMPFEEIASVVGASVNTVKSRMRYALSSLQEIFINLGITNPNDD